MNPLIIAPRSINPKFNTIVLEQCLNYFRVLLFKCPNSANVQCIFTGLLYRRYKGTKTDCNVVSSYRMECPV